MAWNLTGDKPLPKQVVMIRNVAGHRINSLWPNDGAKCLICIGSDNGLLPIGTKPLPEPMLTFQQRNLQVQFQRICTALASSNGVGSYALKTHYGDVIMGAIASQITGPTVVYSIRLFNRRSKKTSKLRVTGLCAWNSPGTGEFPAQMTSNAESVSIWWRHHEPAYCLSCD